MYYTSFLSPVSECSIFSRYPYHIPDNIAPFFPLPSLTQIIGRHQLILGPKPSDNDVFSASYSSAKRS